MHIVLVKAKGVGSLRKYENILKKRLVTYEIQELGKKFTWNKGDENPDLSELNNYCSNLYKTRGESVDAVMFFIDNDDWPNRRIRGRHYNRRRSGYQTSITRTDRS
jgi:hypothetical protein